MYWLVNPAVRWFAFAVLAGGLLCAVAALRAGPPPYEENEVYLTDREAEVGHIVMLAAMLVMVGAPTLDLDNWWRGLFVLLAAFYAVRLAGHAREAKAGGAGVGGRATGAGYHLIASLAMLYSTAARSHPGHLHGSPTWSTSWGQPWPWLAVVLALLFLADAVFTSAVLVTGRVPGSGSHQPKPPRRRVAIIPHLVMDLAMIPML